LSTRTSLHRNTPLAEQLVDILKGRIREGVYAPGAQFPAESQLVQEFDVSRATVRSALNLLAASGQIIRRWGVGTLVSRLAQISNPINRMMEFQELIAASGFQPGVEVRQATLVAADEVTAAALEIPSSSHVLRLEKVFTADGDPVIYVTTWIAEWTLGDHLGDAIARPEITEPLFEFLESICGHRVENSICTFWPDAGEDAIGDVNIDPKTPVLVMDYIAFNDREAPLYRSHQTYMGNKMRFSLIRRRDEIGTRSQARFDEPAFERSSSSGRPPEQEESR
jgi:GntR family transcriptional regulator